MRHSVVQLGLFECFGYRDLRNLEGQRGSTAVPPELSSGNSLSRNPSGYGEETDGEQATGTSMISVASEGAKPSTVEHGQGEVSQQPNSQRKSNLGQFLTPGPVAHFMASLFAESSGEVRLLDAGAGAGSLTAAFLDRWGKEEVSVTAYEIDGTVASQLKDALSRYGNRCQVSVVERDFIQEAVYHIQLGSSKNGFTHAILNPPYRKINSHSLHRALLRAVGLETVNLYTAFVGLAVELMSEGGEMVAIIPRSFVTDFIISRFGSGCWRAQPWRVFTCFIAGQVPSTRTRSCRKTSSLSWCGEGHKEK